MGDIDPDDGVEHDPDDEEQADAEAKELYPTFFGRLFELVEVCQLHIRSACR